MRRFSRETGIRETDWRGKYWARWGDAIREVGLQPNQLQGRFDDELLLEKLAQLVRELGRFPVKAEIQMKARKDRSFPSINTFRRFGGKRLLGARLLRYCQNKPGFDDVVEACRAVAVSEALLTDELISPPPSSTPTIGSVYLIKSGQFYKVGRSNEVGRRSYELAIQLPEEVKLIHEIRTDDPTGIEGYWHRRFSDRRKKGEWFDLSADDVRAFKRRKFM
ncbi:MAG: GIY-YIG nuclease family protein [Gemmatimonadota bacterium]